MIMMIMIMMMMVVVVVVVMMMMMMMIPFSRTPLGRSRSVSMYANIVAILGSIIPAP